MKTRRSLCLWPLVAILISFPLLAGKHQKKDSRKEPVDIGKVQIVVTATKTPHPLEDVPVPAAVITAKQIRELNAQNVGAALRWLPGVEIRSNGYSRATVKIHGLPSKYTLVLVDGQRIKGRHADSIDIGQIPVDMIDRIEVIKGPASVLYGSDAVAGVVNIITKAPPGSTVFNGFFTYGTGNAIRAMASLGGGAGKSLKYLIGGSRNKSDNMGEGYEYDGYNARVSLEYRPGKENALRLISGYFREKSQYLEDEHYNLNFSWDFYHRDGSFLSLKGFYLKSNRLDARPGRDPRTWNEVSGRGEVEYVRLLGEKHLLTLGAESRLDQIEYTLIEGRKAQRIYSFYLQDEASLFRRLNFILALRLDHHDRWGNVFVPRAGVFLNLPRAKVRASVGRGFLAPTLSQLYESTYYHPWSGGFWLGGNPDLKPEYSWGGNLEVEVFLSENVAMRISWFGNYLKNMITSERTGEYIEGKPLFRAVNLDEGRSTGLEAELSGNLSRRFFWNLGYTFLNTEVSSTGREFPYSPHHSVNLLLRYYMPEWGLNFTLAGRYLSKRYANTSNTYILKDSYLIDLSLNKRIFPGMEFFLAVDNLLNQMIEKESKYFRQGRTVYVGVRFEIKKGGEK